MINYPVNSSIFTAAFSWAAYFYADLVQNTVPILKEYHLHDTLFLWVAIITTV